MIIMFLSKMVSASLVAALISACAVLVQCGDVPDRTCGTLFSRENFGGESFTLYDFDQSANLKRDYRPSRAGWTETKSIRVENGCTITACSDTYFQGSCQKFTSEVATLTELMSTIQSVDCSCERSCRCEDFYITDDEKALSGFTARAYKYGGCDTCNSEYTMLYNSGNIQGRDVRALVLYNGCSITLFTNYDSQGNKLRVIEGPIYRVTSAKERLKAAKSFEVTCESSKPIDRSSEFKAYLPLDDLPVNSNSLDELLLSNKTLAKHPGVRAAIDSAKVDRSFKRAYILLIGENSPGSIGFKCTEGYSNGMRECSSTVGVSDLGITTELVIICIPSLLYEESVKGLDAYLSSHEELNRNIPNVVIVSSFIHEDIFSENEFQKTLKVLKEFRHRLIDDNYSNVIFLLQSLHALNPPEQRGQPETRLAQLEEIIRGKLDFLNPVAFSISSGAQMGGLPYINGYGRMENGEFWPRNLEISMVNICEKSGDSLGKSILRAYFKNSLPPRSNTRPIVVENTVSNDEAIVGDSVHGPNYGDIVPDSVHGPNNYGDIVPDSDHGPNYGDIISECNDGPKYGNIVYDCAHGPNSRDIVSDSVPGSSDGEAISGMSNNAGDYTERRTTDKDCGCTAMSTQLKQEIDKLKSELATERTERLIDADRLKADFWEEFKLKWNVHFEL